MQDKERSFLSAVDATCYLFRLLLRVQVGYDTSQFSLFGGVPVNAAFLQYNVLLNQL